MTKRKLENELIDRICHRDKQALEELYDRYEFAVYSVLRRVCHDEAHCERAVHDLFAMIWNKRCQFL